ncbi:hypothetical protein TeGR_g8541, partial [Tetraparma gracilis]
WAWCDPAMLLCPEKAREFLIGDFDRLSTEEEPEPPQTEMV